VPVPPSFSNVPPFMTPTLILWSFCATTVPPGRVISVPLPKMPPVPLHVTVPLTSSVCGPSMKTSAPAIASV
jgi:hypothetical protein